MQDNRMEWIFRHIAEKENTTVQEVRREMLSAMEDAQQNCDPATRARWDSIPRKGDRLTPEEFIEYIATHSI